MFERAYRQRLEADLARWQSEGVITPAIGDAIRGSLAPLGSGINIAVVVGILGGLLIAAAFLAFVAANWSEIARPLRFSILLAGIAGSHGVGIAFARAERPILADLAASVGAIIFGAAIALVGQMYHLGDDFAGGMLLWAGGALAAATLTGSRGALAVALVAGSLWSGARMSNEADLAPLSFGLFWSYAAALALWWNSRLAAHLVAIAALVWWINTVILAPYSGAPAPLTVVGGAALMLGAGLLLENATSVSLIGFGTTLSTYGAFALAGVAAAAAAVSNDVAEVFSAPPAWANVCGGVGTLLALTAGALARRIGSAAAGLAIALILIVANWLVQSRTGEPWVAYALELASMLCLVVSGMLEGARPRIVAGWLGLAAIIASITWAVKGSLLRRSIFLATAGASAIVLAILLGRLFPREARS